MYTLMMTTADHVWEFPMTPGLYWNNSVYKSGLLHIEMGDDGGGISYHGSSDNTKHIYRFRLFELMDTCCRDDDDVVADTIQFFGKTYHCHHHKKVDEKREEEEPGDCAICFTELPTSFRINTACSHGSQFHLSCMESWLATAASQGHD